MSIRVLDILMTLLVWNIREVNKNYKQKELRNYMKTKKIKFISLLETRVKQHRSERISKLIVPGWGFLYN